MGSTGPEPQAFHQVSCRTRVNGCDSPRMKGPDMITEFAPIALRALHRRSGAGDDLRGLRLRLVGGRSRPIPSPPRCRCRSSGAAAPAPPLPCRSAGRRSEAVPPRPGQADLRTRLAAVLTGSRSSSPPSSSCSWPPPSSPAPSWPRPSWWRRRASPSASARSAASVSSVVRRTARRLLRAGAGQAGFERGHEVEHLGRLLRRGRGDDLLAGGLAVDQRQHLVAVLVVVLLGVEVPRQRLHELARHVELAFGRRGSGLGHRPLAARARAPRRRSASSPGTARRRPAGSPPALPSTAARTGRSPPCSPPSSRRRGAGRPWRSPGRARGSRAARSRRGRSRRGRRSPRSRSGGWPWA